MLTRLASHVEGENMADEPVVTPVADATPTPVANDPTPTPTPESVDPGDIDALLAAEITEETPAQPSPDDPFAAVKDNPQFQELSQAAESFKAVMEAAGAPDVKTLQAQIGDAHALYSVVDGKANAGQLMEQLSVYGPEVQQRVAQELASWLTEKGFIQGGAPKDPALVEIENIKAALAQQKEVEQQQALTRRVDGAKSLVHGEIGKFLEAKGLKGQEARFLQLIGPQFAGKEMQLVEAAEKGDFKLVSKALQTAYNNEVKYMQSWFKALKERKQTKQDGIPKIGNAGTGKSEVKKLTTRPPNDSPEFIDWMLQQAQ
jgi:hypothetical protein